MDTLSFKTISVNKETAKKEWVVIDATDQVVGRLCSKVAKLLRGKYKPTFTPHVDCGDNVIIINAAKVVFSGKKETDKVYTRYTGYPGGQRFNTPAELRTRPDGMDKILRHAVKGMLPKGRLGRSLMDNLFIYDGTEHKHEAQKPKAIDINLRRKWNPAMAPYIFMERNGIHIIDLNKTVAKVDEAAEVLKGIAKSGKKILFVATKKQAKDIVAEKAASVNMPYVIERWPGGMLTNFPTIRKAVKKMANIDKLMNDGTFSNLSKRELLQVSRQRAKLEKNLGSIADLTRLPSALFVIDVMKEHIAVKEANRLGIPVFGIVDTNSDPKNIDYIIPANDDAKDSVEVILSAVCGAIAEGLEERKAEKADEKAAAEQKDQPKKKAARKEEAAEAAE